MPDIEYTRVGWQNAPDMSTPLSATNLNTMENGIVAAIEAANELRVRADNLEDDTELLENRVGLLEESLVVSPSHVGMIVMSTMLDTMEKVIAVYGGTAWIQHSGYFLRASTANVTANSAVSNGGEESVTLTESQLPEHTHTIPQHRHSLGERNVYVGSGAAVAVVNYGAGSDNDANTGYSAEGTSGSSGSGEAHNNMPPFKNVYVWERTA